MQKSILIEPLQHSDAVEAMLKQLKNPFDPKFVKCRVGATDKVKTKGIALFYIDSREVMKRLDEVCGMDGWARKETETSKGCICELSVRMPYLVNGNEKWVLKADVGEFTKSSDFKGASSDSLKRAAVNFGIGRYLYYVPNQWYPLNEKKQFAVKPTLPSWATPQAVEDWEAVAIREYDQKHDVGLDGVDFADEQAKEELETSKRVREDIIASLKAKKND